MNDLKQLKDLADIWDRRALKLDRQSSDQPNKFTVERMLAEANTLQVCASELRRKVIELEES